MELILWRHAEAEDGTPDSARKLTDKGIRQAQNMAGWLQSRLPDDARILVSPTQRTRQTALSLKRKAEITDAVGTSATILTILTTTGWPDAAGTIIIVGHQPVLGELAARLMTGTTTTWRIRKGAVWWFRTDAASTLLRAVMTPDML